MSHRMSHPAAACTGPKPGGDARRMPTRRPAAAHLAELRSRDGLVPVCSWCRKARTGAGIWTPVEAGLLEGAGVVLTHGVCPDCAQELLAPKHEPPHEAA